MAYVMLVDRLERHVATERLIAAMAMVNGAEGVTLPVFGDQQALFHEALEEDPAVAHNAAMSERADLRIAVGLP